MLDSLSFPRLDLWRHPLWRNNKHRFSPEIGIVARLKIVDKDFWIDGAVLQLTEDNALFREVSAYVLKRHNEEVLLEMESVEYRARIASTDRFGYRLEFFELLPESLVADLSDRWRIET